MLLLGAPLHLAGVEVFVKMAVHARFNWSLKRIGMVHTYRSILHDLSQRSRYVNMVGHDNSDSESSVVL